MFVFFKCLVQKSVNGYAKIDRKTRLVVPIFVKKVVVKLVSKQLIIIIYRGVHYLREGKTKCHECQKIMREHMKKAEA